MSRRPTQSTLFPYTTLFRSVRAREHQRLEALEGPQVVVGPVRLRSEEHTSELQSRENLVCRLLLEKKKMYSLLYFGYVVRLKPPKLLLTATGILFSLTYGAI